MAFVGEYIDMYGEVHDSLVEVIESLAADGLNWEPYGGTNSIAILVAHTLGNHLETLRTVRGIPTARNRDAEFQIDAATRADLLALVAEARDVMADLAPQITPEQLEKMTVRPSRSKTTPQTGMRHLMHSLAHAREHLGQIWVTRDLWSQKA